MTALLTVFVPISLGSPTFLDNATVNGNRVENKYATRVHNGHAVVDIPMAFFLRQLDGPQGKQWVDANPEVIHWMGEQDRRTMFCNAFPGEHRAPPLAPNDAKPTEMVRLIAPHGVTSYSHEGKEHEIASDGEITVPDHVAEVLRAHGFRRAA